MGCYFLGCPVIAVAAAAVTFALWCVKCLIMYDLYAETEHDFHMEFLEWEKDGKQEEEQTQAA